ncbi:O-antigen ligase family protein [Pseudazoarcus pumilus]|uniref:O-antigen ligase domain-containing protein n=1 Tax=Pseudazoarcus pumilus TaxID=2067960 RepID=A0A2I6S8Z2_9RHOO|nr:O-antigen ligase family protein [Pseudazoarcus pumilus]AUN95716.1 hypothetical protein C0099_12705 [Pseudazoarcus pumilus]
MRWIDHLNLRTLSYAAIALVCGLSIFMLVDLRGLGMLPLSFSEPFSSANLQGRNVIWARLWEAFIHADAWQMIIGMGLAADSFATTYYAFTGHLVGARAHNSYLYLILCTGVLGFGLFAAFVIEVLRHVSRLIGHDDEESVRLGLLTGLFLLIFPWFSLTTEIVIRPQLMVLLFFFAGVAVQRSLLITSVDKKR